MTDKSVIIANFLSRLAVKKVQKHFSMGVSTEAQFKAELQDLALRELDSLGIWSECLESELVRAAVSD